MQPKILFVLPKGLSFHIIKSQLLVPVTLLSNRIKNKYLIRAEDIKEKVAQEVNVSNITKISQIINSEFDTVYTRSIYDFWLMYILRFFRFKYKYDIIYDFRGLVAEESYYRHSNRFKKTILTAIERNTYKRADQLHCVSQQFKKFLIQNFGKRDNIKVIPCCVSDNYRKIRRDRSVDEDTTFVYCGSASKWQKVEETVYLYGLIEEQLKNCSLTIYTGDQNAFKKLIVKYSIKNVTITKLPHEKLMKRLNNYDFGFLIRDDHVINNVASPIKFIEYISRGVIPIMTENIGDYSYLIKRSNAGYILDDLDKIDTKKLKKLLNNDKVYEKLYTLSESYTWDKVLGNLKC